MKYGSRFVKFDPIVQSSGSDSDSSDHSSFSSSSSSKSNESQITDPNKLDYEDDRLSKKDMKQI